MNIFKNVIPYETITCNDKDSPWMNKQIKTLITGKKDLYKRLKRIILNSKLPDRLDAFIDALQGKLQSSIHFSQFEYYRKILKK